MDKINHRLTKVEKLTNEKYLNLYKASYDINNGERTLDYFIASRQTHIDTLYLKRKIKKTNAVRAVPYFYKNDKIYVVIIKQFRYTLNDYIYEAPAGIIDNNESEEEAIMRELKEEIGASTISLQKTENSSFTTVGISDELITNFEAEIVLDNTQHLDANEDIEILIIPIEEAFLFIENVNADLLTKLQYKQFYYKCLINKLKKY